MSFAEAKILINIILGTVIPWLLLIALTKLLVARYGKALRNQDRVQVLVLGDVGRSPRMQYHALSLAKHGFHVDLIGYLDSPVHPDIVDSPKIRLTPLQHHPSWLNAPTPKFFILFGPLKALLQIWSLLKALLYQTEHSGWLLVQNPPAIPTLLVALFVSFSRNARLVIDWHNFGYSILALKLGDRHPMVGISRLYEGLFSRTAYAHLCVTNAMAKVLQKNYGLSAPVVVFHDRPAEIFQVISSEDLRSDFVQSLSKTLSLEADWAESLTSRSTKLIVSSTSWTPDEEFSILVDALTGYCAEHHENQERPRIVMIITGKGPQRADFESEVRNLEKSGRLDLVKTKTIFFDDLADYAKLLASADVGVSLHTSSSGVDLPMKVVDMFGAGLPVVGWNDFEAWPELVTDGKNGFGFQNAPGLEQLLVRLLCGDPGLLSQLKRGAVEESKHRWDEEWDRVAIPLFKSK